LGYSWQQSFSVLKISPKSQKYSAELSHRDFLGSILNLGIKREVLGDILVWENQGFVFVLEHMAEYIIENLQKVHNTAVTVVRIETLPEGVRAKTEERVVIAASARLDAILSAVWNLSRSEGKELVEKEKVSVAGRVITNPSYLLSEGERVSVRGKGRFYFLGVNGETRSGRGRMKIRMFLS
jgi:RNA-binding protein YlmH